MGWAECGSTYELDGWARRMSSSRLCNWCHEETRLKGSVGANRIMPSSRTNSFHGACQYQARKIELDPFGVWSRLEILTADRPTTPVTLAVSMLDLENPITSLKLLLFLLNLWRPVVQRPRLLPSSLFTPSFALLSSVALPSAVIQRFERGAKGSGLRTKDCEMCWANL